MDSRTKVHMYQIGVYTPPMDVQRTDDFVWEIVNIYYPYRKNIKFNERWLDEFQPKQRR